MLKLLLRMLLPSWMIEMSHQLRTQDNRIADDPIWQVRIKEYVPTDSERNVFGFVMYDDDGEFYKSWTNDDPIEVLRERYPDKMNEQEDEFDILNLPEDLDVLGIDCIDYCYVQQVERVVSTHLTEPDAEWFIERKGHDYPGAYIHVEAAGWSPQIKKLRAWLIALTA